MALKLECYVCKIKFGNEEEEIEHYCALSHHIKQGREQPTSKRVCILCTTTYETLADYSRHIDSEQHKKSIEKFRRTKELMRNVGSANTTGTSNSGNASQQTKHLGQEGASSSSSSRSSRLQRAPLNSASTASRRLLFDKLLRMPSSIYPPYLPQPTISKSLPNMNFAKDSLDYSFSPPSSQTISSQSSNRPKPVPLFPPKSAGMPHPFSQQSTSSLGTRQRIPYSRFLSSGTSSNPENSRGGNIPQPTDIQLLNSGIVQRSPATSVQQPQLTNSGQKRSPFHRPRPVLLQSPVSLFEPVIPMVAGHLARSERYPQSTLFMRSKLRADLRRLSATIQELRLQIKSNSGSQKKEKSELKKLKQARKRLAIQIYQKPVDNVASDDMVSASTNETGNADSTDKKIPAELCLNEKALSMKKAKKKKNAKRRQAVLNQEQELIDNSEKSSDETGASMDQHVSTACMSTNDPVPSILNTTGTGDKRQQTEADSTTTIEMGRRKSLLSAAAWIKRRRLVSKSQAISDRLLADRLNRFRLIPPPSQQDNSNVAGTSGDTVKAPSVPSTTSTADTTRNTVATTRIDANLCQRARNLFIPSTSGNVPSGTLLNPMPTKDLPVTSTEIRHSSPQPTLRLPKPEQSYEIASGSTSEQATNALNSQLPSTQSTSPGTSGSSNLPNAMDSSTPASSLQQLWIVCKREEQIRAEQRQVNEEMERLKQELHRVWYRSKELQQEAEECEKQKKALLENSGSGT